MTKYDELIEIQKTLFSIGGYYANEIAVTPYVKEEDIEHIEFCIDCLEKSLPVLQSFILPGGVAEASIRFAGQFEEEQSEGWYHLSN